MDMTKGNYGAARFSEQIYLIWGLPPAFALAADARIGGFQ